MPGYASGTRDDPLSDVVKRLNAKMDEIESQTKKAVHKTGTWEWHCPHKNLESVPPSHDCCAVIHCDEIAIYDEGGHSPEQAEHIAYWDPATVLRMVAATRELMELHRHTANSPTLLIEAKRWGLVSND